MDSTGALPLWVRETRFQVAVPGDAEEAVLPVLEDLSLVVLNYDLPPFTHLLWRQAGGLRVCADGGANQLYDTLPSAYPGEDPDSVRSRFIPDVIKGDLDSIRPDVRAFYQAKGSTILDLHEDQDSTDLHKCILHICTHYARTNSTAADNQPASGTPTSRVEIVAVGGLGGRVDHEFGNMNVLHQFPGVRITLLSQHATLALLPPRHRNVLRPSRGFEGPHCGLIPVAGPSKGTTTTGLRWNLTNRGMEFGALISTSNQMVEEEVTVESDVPLLWTTEIRLPTTQD